VGNDNQPAVPAPSGLEFLRGLITEATKDDDTLRRYLKLFRSTVLVMVIATLAGSLIFGVGVAIAVAVAGVHMTTAISIGAGGSATFIVTAVLRSRRYLQAFLRAYSNIDQHGS